MLYLWAYFMNLWYKLPNKYSNSNSKMKNNIQQTYHLLSEKHGIREPLCNFKSLVNYIWKQYQEFQKSPKEIPYTNNPKEMMYVCDFNFGGKYLQVYFINDPKVEEGGEYNDTFIMLNIEAISDITDIQSILKHELRHYHDWDTNMYTNGFQSLQMSDFAKSFGYRITKLELNGYLETVHQNFLGIVQKNSDKSSNWFLEKVGDENGRFAVPRIISMDEVAYFNFKLLVTFFGTYEKFQKKMLKNFGDNQIDLIMLLFQMYIDYIKNEDVKSTIEIDHPEKSSEFPKFCRLIGVKDTSQKLNDEQIKHIFEQKIIRNIYYKISATFKHWMKQMFALAQEVVQNKGSE